MIQKEAIVHCGLLFHSEKQLINYLSKDKDTLEKEQKEHEEKKRAMLDGEPGVFCDFEVL